jgi:lipase chaperone LimK
MTKTIGVFSAISLLVILLLIASKKITLQAVSSTGYNLVAVKSDNAQQQINSTVQTELNSSVKNSHNVLKAQLFIDVYLRYKFDDIIHQHREQQSPLKSQLLTLAKSLNLHKSATNTLNDLFNRYQYYLSEMFTMKEQAPDTNGLVDLSDSQLFLQQVYRLQYQYFSEIEIMAFFDKEKRYDQQVLERMAIRQDLSLSETQRHTLIQYQISQLGPNELAALQPTMTANNINSYLLTNHLSDPLGEIASALVVDTNLNAKILNKINLTKKSNQLWQQKVLAYKKKSIDSKDLQQAELSAVLDSYQLQHFSENERKRLKVFLKHPELLNTAQP